MSIHFISGKPRGGKSLYAVKLVIEELVHGTRVVITNLAFKLPELNEYLQRMYPEKSIDLFQRMVLINDDELKVFFTIRPKGFRGPKLISKEDWKAGKYPDYSGCNGDGGVLYALDEVHVAFNARQWMETGADVLFYLSQHGKLGDTVLCITQHIGNVDKQFRSVTQDYTYLKNLSKAKVAGFRLPPMFMRRTFSEPATPTSTAMESGTFRLDVTGLASVYDTAKGVGIHGRNADKSEKAKGFSILWPAIIIPVLLWVLYAYGPKAMVAFFSPERSKPVAAAPMPATAPAKAPTTSLLARPPEKPAAPESYPGVTVPVSNPPPVYCLGIHRLRGYWEVYLSDGQTYREGDMGLDQVSRQGATIFGKFYPMQRLEPGESSFKGYAPPEPPPPAERTFKPIIVAQ